MDAAGVEATRKLVHLAEAGSRALEIARTSLERGGAPGRAYLLLIKSARRVHEATRDACGIADPAAVCFALRVTGDSIEEAERICLRYGSVDGTA